MAVRYLGNGDTGVMKLACQRKLRDNMRASIPRIIMRLVYVNTITCITPLGAVKSPINIGASAQRVALAGVEVEAVFTANFCDNAAEMRQPTSVLKS